MVFTHLDEKGNANMVDVSPKTDSIREATAEGFVYMSPETLKAVSEQHVVKGDVLSVARIAGIQGAKQCSNLVPLCHPLALSKVSVDFNIDHKLNRIEITSLCKLTGKTGVEMEALTAVSVAALTVFDMCKASDPSMHIEGIRVLTKKGGKSGEYDARDI